MWNQWTALSPPFDGMGSSTRFPDGFGAERWVSKAMGVFRKRDEGVRDIRFGRRLSEGRRRSPVGRFGRRRFMVASVAVARPELLEEERELCESARAGDRAALGKLLRKYGPVLYRSVLLPRLGSEASAQDALADTYARVVERFHQFQWQSCGIYPWLRVIALRIALDILRAKKRELLFEPEDLEREIDASETDFSAHGEVELCEKRDMADARSRVDAALSKLNPRYADAIRLRVLEERSREEVAAELGVSVATFDVVLHRAMAALKKALAAGPGKEAAPQKETVR